jgi:hypothetical protein
MILPVPFLFLKLDSLWRRTEDARPLAFKWSWSKRRQAEGKLCDQPNPVMGADLHTVSERFARYFDVELN